MFYTSSTSGKAKRLKNNPKVVVQPQRRPRESEAGHVPAHRYCRRCHWSGARAIYDKVVAKYGFMTKVTRFLAKVGGFVKRKDQPYADRAVVVTLSE